MGPLHPPLSVSEFKQDHLQVEKQAPPTRSRQCRQQTILSPPPHPNHNRNLQQGRKTEQKLPRPFVFFFLKNTLEGKFVLFLFTFYIFVHIVRGPPFLKLTGDQTGLQMVLCLTSEFTCGVSMFIIITKEKSTL